VQLFGGVRLAALLHWSRREPIHRMDVLPLGAGVAAESFKSRIGVYGLWRDVWEGGALVTAVDVLVL